MGDILKVTCSDCSYEREFQVGMGILYEPLNRYVIVSEIESKLMQDEILQTLETEQDNVFAKKELYYCEKCYRLAARLTVMVGRVGKKYTTQYRCPHCNKAMKVTAFGDKTHHCPKCKVGTLMMTRVGHWD